MTPEQIVEDFRRRYEGTYVFLQEPSSTEENLVYVESIRPDTEKLGILTLTSEEIGKIRLNFHSAHSLKFVKSPTGVYQHGPHAVMFTRRPRKQYRRGICPDNTSMQIVGSLFTRELLPFSWETVAAAFAHKVYVFKAALSMLASGKVRSVALTDNYSLSLSFTGKSTDYLMMFWNLPVAKITQDGKVSQVIEEAFAKQIESIIKG